MIRKIKRTIKKANRILKRLSGSVRQDYLKFSSLPIDDNLVLLEGGQGTNINGNMFAMLKQINENPRWKNYKTAFVVTNDTKKAARERMNFYGFSNVIICERDSREYCKLLATAKYIMTDNSFPPYFSKREGQIFLNTWHGTPLKTLGMSDKSFKGSTANIQKNYLMCDYALFPNEFTKNVFMQDYSLDGIFTGRSLLAAYPRNYIFYNAQQGRLLKNKLGLDGMTVFAYMPTWRGTGRKANTKKQITDTVNILKEFDSKLSDDQVILVNLHFLLASEIDCSVFKHIRYFDTQYDTYEVLNACDGLITDYSSVFFDFAITGKKIILYAYDEEEYFNTRGMYISLDELPFSITHTVSETVEQMRCASDDYSDFIKQYCPNGSYSQCEDIFDMMVSGGSEKFDLVSHHAAKDLCLLYAGNLVQRHFEIIREYVSHYPDRKWVIVYSKNLTQQKMDFFRSLPNGIGFLGLITAFQLKRSDYFKVFKFRYLHSIKSFYRLSSFFESDADRRFYSVKPDYIVDFSCGDPIIAGTLISMSGKKEYVKHGDFYVSTDSFIKKMNFVRLLERKNGFTVVDNSKKENDIYLELNKENPYSDVSFRKISKFNNILPFYMSSSKRLKCVSFFSFSTPFKIAMRDTSLYVGNYNVDYKLIGSKNKLSKKHYGIYSFSVPVDKIIDMPATNKVMMCYKNKYEKIVRCHASYWSMLPGGLFLGLRSSMLRDPHTNTIAVFRQSTKNNLNVYVRSFITSDKFIHRIKQTVAYILSLFWFGKKAKRLVLLFEKNSSKYEESASVLFEKLIDSGYKYAYFIIDRNYKYFDSIPKKYLSNILYKNSFKHYLYFFKAKNFIGTETMVHSIDLKIFNIFALKKIADKNINYVFLQHGVMYMVSLDSESRRMFKRRELNGKYRVVVSSKAEADHFVQLGRHEYEDLYICGLPKFDRNTLNDDADKIIIMPTWRPWEINMARDNFMETSYFKMVMRIYNNVPDDLKEKVIILPHPLIMNEIENLPADVYDAIMIDAKYNDILKQARILITDYSSIAYDAFYRGTRVIFYWEEKDECIAHYGPSTKLMLNDDNVYGDYFYSEDGLRESIEYNYYNPQSEENIRKYSKIVQFHDGHNTDRLIKFLKKDNII